MAVMSEALTILNGILFDGRANVTTSPQTLLDMFAIPDNIRGQIKTVTIRNFGASNVYVGTDSTITTSNAGGYIEKGARLEMPMPDLQKSPYFISASSVEMGIIVWG